MIGCRSLTSIVRLTLEILNEMPIVKQIDSLKLIARTIQTLKPAMQLRHEKLKLIRLLRQKLELTNLIDLKKSKLEPRIRIDSPKSILESTIQTGLPKLKLELVTLTGSLKSTLVPVSLIDLQRSKLELVILTDSMMLIANQSILAIPTDSLNQNEKRT